jgi:succinate dehydrogenase / fumarate reductase, cytochrome b subunit
VIVHLSLNLLLIFDDKGDLFNIAAHFMATNPMVKIMEPILALGFIIHLIWSLILTVQNMKARPVKYTKTSQSVNSTWVSRNMIILGLLIFVFLGLHLFNFFWKIKFAPETLGTVQVMQAGVLVSMEDSYTLVAGLFKGSVIYCLIYIFGGCLLGLHISHGFWSAFQTIGLNNVIWRKRLNVLANIFGWIFAVGFSIIPIYFMFKF